MLHICIQRFDVTGDRGNILGSERGLSLYGTLFNESGTLTKYELKMAVFMLLFSPAQPCRENVNSSNFSFHINVKITVVSTRLQRDLNIHPLAPKK
jgi:hypothetical protein